MAGYEKVSVPYDENLGPRLYLEPPSDHSGDERVFEIGLVLAGAVSAGAYTGGVLDFLFEALDALQAARGKAEAGDVAFPFKHRVRLKVISGASAGGMTAAMVATAAKRSFPHIRNTEDAKEFGDSNPFYRPWVRQIDMRQLLGTRDLPRGGEVRSLLDCTPLDDILRSSLDFRVCSKEDMVDRDWLDEPLRLVFAITNLRGVAYSFAFDGSDGATYAMTRHNDCARFWVNVKDVPRTEASMRPDETPLSYRTSNDNDAWKQLGQAALATASFPVALRARTVRPNPGIYQADWLITSRVSTFEQKFKADGEVVHLIEAGRGQVDRRYAAADGGIINNEPLELARIELAGILGHNPREGYRACRSLIMVDPFPDPPTQDTFLDAESESMLSLAGGIVSAMKNQGRFHPEDIRLALDEGTASRFMISPSGRERRTGGHAIASGALGGFSGFLSETYRQHDFLLGRANCQKFLRDHFSLKLVDEENRRPWLFGDNVNPIEGHDFVGHDGIMRRPILPLFGTAAEECKRPEWPIDAFDPADLRGAVSRRIQAVGSAYIAKIGAFPLRWLFASAWGAMITGGLIRRQLTTTIINALRNRLKAHELLSDGKGRA